MYTERASAGGGTEREKPQAGQQHQWWPDVGLLEPETAKEDICVREGHVQDDCLCSVVFGTLMGEVW